MKHGSPEWMAQLEKDLPNLSLNSIAVIIDNDWSNVYFGAKPYLTALTQLETVNDNFGADSGKSIVIYFLSNAQTWRGDVARLVKAELNKRLKSAK